MGKKKKTKNMKNKMNDMTGTDGKLQGGLGKAMGEIYPIKKKRPSPRTRLYNKTGRMGT